MKLGHGEKYGRSLNLQQQCCLGEGTGIFEDGGDEKQICTIDLLNFCKTVLYILYDEYPCV